MNKVEAAIRYNITEQLPWALVYGKPVAESGLDLAIQGFNVGFADVFRDRFSAIPKRLSFVLGNSTSTFFNHLPENLYKDCEGSFRFHHPDLARTFQIIYFMSSEELISFLWQDLPMDVQPTQGGLEELWSEFEHVQLNDLNKALSETNRQLAEKDLLFTQLAENTNDLFMLWEVPDKLLYINKRFKDIFERETDLLEDNLLSIFQCVHPEYQDEVLNKFLEARKKQLEFLELEFPIMTPAGKVKWLWYREKVIFNNQKLPYRRAAVVTDITDRYKSRDDLRQYQQYLDSIIENLPLGLQIFDASGNSQRVNKKFERFAFLQDRQQDICGYFRHTGVRLSPQDRFFRHVFQEKTLSIREFQAPVPGAQSPVRALKEIAFPLLDKEGQVQSVIALIEDITARKMTEKALMESEEKFRQLIENIDIIFWVRKGSNRQFEYVSPAFEGLLKSQPDELYKDPGKFLQHVHPDDADKLHTFFNDGFQQEVRGLECRMLIGRKTKWFKINTYLISYDDGHKKQIGIMEDITKRKQSMLMLVKKNRELIKANKELDEFVYRTSHNLRSPLTSIQGIVQLMKMQHLNEELDKYCRMIEKSIAGLDYTIRDIVEFSKNARTGLSADSVDVKLLLEEVLDSLQFMYQDHSVQVKKDVCLDQPVISDKERIRVLLVNTLSNSFRYLDRTKQVHRVTITAVLDDQLRLVLTVHDNGMGIPDIHQERIFDLFYKGTAMSAGAGLGLAVVRETIDKMKASLVLDSKVGEGTMIKMTIPQIKQKEEKNNRGS